MHIHIYIYIYIYYHIHRARDQKNVLGSNILPRDQEKCCICDVIYIIICHVIYTIFCRYILYSYLRIYREKERQIYTHIIYIYKYTCREVYCKCAKLDLNKKVGGGLGGRAQCLPPKQNDNTCFHKQCCSLNMVLNVFTMPNMPLVNM